jgi:hypothetical protein
MIFDEIETALATFLTSKMGTDHVSIIPNPDKDEEFERVFGKELIIVAFSDEEPSQDQKSLGMVYQEASVTFAFLIQSNSLRSGSNKLGVYGLYKELKKYIIGHVPNGGQAFTYAGFKFLAKENGVFQYAAYFKTKTFEAQQTDNDDEIKFNLREVSIK